MSPRCVAPGRFKSPPKTPWTIQYKGRKHYDNSEDLERKFELREKYDRGQARLQHGMQGKGGQNKKNKNKNNDKTKDKH